MTIHIFGDSYADPGYYKIYEWLDVKENAWYNMLDEEVVNYGKSGSGPIYSLSLLFDNLKKQKGLDPDIKKVVFFLSSKYRIPASFTRGEKADLNDVRQDKIKPESDMRSEITLKHLEQHRDKNSSKKMKWDYEFNILFDSVKDTLAFSVYRDLSFLRFLSDFYKFKMICFILHEKPPTFWSFINSLNSENYFIYPKNFHEEVSSRQGVSNVYLRNHLIAKNHIVLSEIIKKYFNNDRNFPEFFTVDQKIDEPYIYE